MTDVLQARRHAAGVLLAAALVAAFAMLAFVPKARAAGCTSGTLIKGTSLSAVYYCGADGKRYVFTNDKAYFTWYPDFSGVRIMSDAELGGIAIGGNVTYRPGQKMIKIQSDPKVYVISRGGVLRHVPDEQCAATLYGSNWNKKIDDVSDAFFVNYSVGSPLATCSDFSVSGEAGVSVSINIDKNLTGAIVLPAVVSVSPSAGATNVSLNSDVSATFSRKMKASTLSTGTFTLTASGTGSAGVSGTVDYSGNTATFNPGANLAANTTYTAVITTGVKDEDDRGLSVNYSWTFTTGAAASGSAAPTVSSVSPASGATGVAVNADVKAVFSTAMSASTLNGSTFTLTKSGSTSVSGTVTYSGNTATFDPSADLEANTTYTATVTTGAKNQDGTGLSTNYGWTFTTAGSATGSTQVIAIAPADGGTGVAITTPITVTFSGAMDASTLHTGTFTLMKGSVPVAGTVTYAGNTATFTPSASLEAGMTYTARVTSGARDAGGSALVGGGYSWNFTTAP